MGTGEDSALWKDGIGADDGKIRVRFIDLIVERNETRQIGEPIIIDNLAPDQEIEVNATETMAIPKKITMAVHNRPTESSTCTASSEAPPWNRDGNPDSRWSGRRPQASMTASRPRTKERRGQRKAPRGNKAPGWNPASSSSTRWMGPAPGKD